MDENKTEPLAKTRTRRSNAGARMHEMMFAAENDELFAQAYGGLLKTDDDSSDDEEYVPKDLLTADGEAEIDDNDDDDGGDDDDDDSDSEDSGDTSADDDEEDADEDEARDKNDPEDDGNKSRVRNVKSTNSLDYEPQLSNKELLNKNPLESAIQPYYLSPVRTCSVCLGDQSGEEYVIECDSCGVQVHESCYGVTSDDEESSDGASDHSYNSSRSTEPWFCEPCIRSVRNPYCELCPNRGGIFKQTDTGRWVHMVCALYTRGVTFENTETLTGVSLFELNYSLFGSKVRFI